MKKNSVLLGTIILAVPILLGVSPGLNASRTSLSSNSFTTVSTAAPPSDGQACGEIRDFRRPPRLRSTYVKIVDSSNQSPLFSRKADRKVPIASITKLMTAMVVLDSHPPMDKVIRITSADVDTLRHSRSRLPVGWKLTRWQLLNLALMCSENRAAHALARTYPGGCNFFVKAMNAKARSLDMNRSRFYDPTGLDGRDVSTAGDLVRLVEAASGYFTISRMTTMSQLSVKGGKRGRTRLFGNSNRLIHNRRWKITLSKTGYINEAGYCLVMNTVLKKRSIVFVLLDSNGKNSRLGDAIRIKRWLTS